MSIEFTGGFTITQGGITPEIGNYYLSPSYTPAINQGEITIPKHDNGTWTLDFNDVNENTGNAIYINKFDSNNNDNSVYLTQLVGNHTHLTFTQNSYHITFDCTNQAWQDGGVGGPNSNQVLHDPTFGNAPQNSISIISTSGVTFNNIDPVGITIQVI
jgi:hypothetical protein